MSVKFRQKNNDAITQPAALIQNLISNIIHVTVSGSASFFLQRTMDDGQRTMLKACLPKP